MAYFITKGGYTIDENNVVIPMDDTSPLYPAYLSYLQNEGTVLQSEFETPEEIVDKVNAIRKDYSDRISAIEGMQEAIERKLIEGIDIPQNILDKREFLRTEYRTRINQ